MARANQENSEPAYSKLLVRPGEESAEPVEFVNPITGEVGFTDEGLLKRVDLDMLDFSQLSAQDFADLGSSLGLSVDDISALVDRWPLFDKAELARSETPLEFFQWKFGEGRYAKPGEVGFVMIWARRVDTGAQGTIYDGGTGIRDQLQALTARRLIQGKPAYNFATVSKITRSDYESENGPATTYYLS